MQSLVHHFPDTMVIACSSSLHNSAKNRVGRSSLTDGCPWEDVPGSHLTVVEMKSQCVLYTLSCRRDLCILLAFSAPWGNPVPTHSGQSCHKDAYRTPTVNHIWQRPGVKTFTATLKGDMEWPSVAEWNPFSCCMDQLFPSLIPAPHSAHSGLHSLFLSYTSVLIFLISWYPSPRYIAKPLSLKSCPVITVWLNTHLWDKICGKDYASCQNWGRVSNDDLEHRSAVKCRIAEQIGIQTIAAKLEKTAMAAEVGRGWEGALCHSGFWNRRDTLHSWKYDSNTFL